MHIEPYDVTKNPEYSDLVIDALLAESRELEGIAVDREHIRRLLGAKGPVQCLVAREGEVLLGTIILSVGPLWYAPKVLVARDLLVWVAPEHRGGSTFIRMIRAMEAWARNVGIAKIYLSQSTGIEVDKTARLYEKLGYSVSGFLSCKRMG